jgi:hypothetical protein
VSGGDPHTTVQTLTRIVGDALAAIDELASP